MGLDTCQDLWAVCQEVFQALISLVLIAGMARYDQVGDPVTSSFGTRLYMVDFERDACETTVGAPVLPFREQILAKLRAEERPPLILQSL